MRSRPGIGRAADGGPRRAARALLPRGGRAARRRAGRRRRRSALAAILRDVENDLKPVYRAMYDNAYRDDPPPRRDLLPRRSFLTTTSLIATRGCHNRCGFCYLATDGLRMPYRVRDVEQVAQEFLADDQPYGVFIDNNLGSRPEYLRRLCRALAPLQKDLERGAHARRHRRPVAGPGDGARRLHGSLHRLRIAFRRQPRRRRASARRGPRTTRGASPSCTTTGSR